MTISLSPLTNARSYLGFPCVACKAPVSVYVITADSATPTPELSGDIRLHCPHCGKDGDYALSLLRRFEEPQMHG